MAFPHFLDLLGHETLPLQSSQEICVLESILSGIQEISGSKDCSASRTCFLPPLPLPHPTCWGSVGGRSRSLDQRGWGSGVGDSGPAPSACYREGRSRLSDRKQGPPELCFMVLSCVRSRPLGRSCQCKTDFETYFLLQDYK